jgi:hypothetical protein
MLERHKGIWKPWYKMDALSRKVGERQRKGRRQREN